MFSTCQEQKREGCPASINPSLAQRSLGIGGAFPYADTVISVVAVCNGDCHQQEEERIHHSRHLVRPFSRA